MAEKIVQTAGRNQLGEFAPMFAHLNDDVLFGEVWNEEAISVKTKCIITVVSLMASGITDSSLTYHLQNAKAHGVTKEEIAAIITHATMYVGWPKGWAVFRLAKEVWNENEPALTEKERFQNTIFFPVGDPNPYGEFFVGQSYLAPVSTEQVPVFNVTFEPGCRNNWHIHHAKSGGGQMLICVGGRGYYQEWGKEAVEMTPGTVINIPANVKHWHGAAPDSWFSHLAIEVAGEEAGTEWLEAVSQEDYSKLKDNRRILVFSNMSRRSLVLVLSICIIGFIYRLLRKRAISLFSHFRPGRVQKRGGKPFSIYHKRLLSYVNGCGHGRQSGLKLS